MVLIAFNRDLPPSERNGESEHTSLVDLWEGDCEELCHQPTLRELEYCFSYSEVIWRNCYAWVLLETLMKLYRPSVSKPRPTGPQHPKGNYVEVVLAFFRGEYLVPQGGSLVLKNLERATNAKNQVQPPATTYVRLARVLMFDDLLLYHRLRDRQAPAHEFGYDNERYADVITYEVPAPKMSNAATEASRIKRCGVFFIISASRFAFVREPGDYNIVTIGMSDYDLGERIRAIKEELGVYGHTECAFYMRLSADDAEEAEQELLTMLYRLGLAFPHRNGRNNQYNLMLGCIHPVHIGLIQELFHQLSKRYHVVPYNEPTQPPPEAPEAPIHEMDPLARKKQRRQTREDAQDENM